jgi:hypothetical protein
MWINGNEVKQAAGLNTDNLDGTIGVCATHPFYFKYGRSVLYVYSTSNPASAFTSMEFPTQIVSGVSLDETVSFRDADYITIDGLDIQGSGFTSIGLNGSDYVTITNCNVGKYSNWAAVYGDYNKGTDVMSSYVTISNDTIDSDWDYPYVFYTQRTPYGVCAGNNTSYWDIANNFIKDWWMSVYIVPNGSPSYYHDVYGNEITSTMSLSKGFQISGYYVIAGDTLIDTYCRFYNNYVHNIVVGLQLMTSKNQVFYNIFDSMTVSTNLHTTQSNSGFGIQHATDFHSDLPPDSNFVFNNTFYDLNNNGIVYGTPFTYNNLFLNNNKRTTTSTSISTVYRNYYVNKNNLFYRDGTDSTDGFVYLSSFGQIYSVSNFNNISATDSILGNLYPVGKAMSEVMTFDDYSYIIPTGSPALNAGVNVNDRLPYGWKLPALFEDRFGNVVDQTQPNIGAVDNTP